MLRQAETFYYNQRINKGSIRSWSDVGGEKHAISVVSRNPSSGTYRVWMNQVVQTEEKPENHHTQSSNSAILAYVAGHPNALGYISFGYINNDVKALSLDGVTANMTSGKNRQYPILRPMYLYVRENAFPHHMKAFIIYLLGHEGQKTVEQNRMITAHEVEKFQKNVSA